MTRYTILRVLDCDAQLVNGRALWVESNELSERFRGETEFEDWTVKVSRLGVKFTRKDNWLMDVDKLIERLSSDSVCNASEVV